MFFRQQQSLHPSLYHIIPKISTLVQKWNKGIQESTSDQHCPQLSLSIFYISLYCALENQHSFSYQPSSLTLVDTCGHFWTYFCSYLLCFLINRHRGHLRTLVWTLVDIIFLALFFVFLSVVIVDTSFLTNELFLEKMNMFWAGNFITDTLENLLL